MRDRGIAAHAFDSEGLEGLRASRPRGARVMTAGVWPSRADDRRPAQPAAAMNVRQALRSATAGCHARLDAAFSGFDLGRVASYRAFLRAHARVLPAIEARVVEWEAWPVFEPRRARLLADLEALGLPPPPTLCIPPCVDAAAAWGLLYVLEGSRLGGALLARQVGPGLPRDYLSAGHTGGSWRRFLDALEAAGAPGGPAWLAAAVTGAIQAFERFGEAATLEIEADHAR